ncbi:ribonuclease H-like domain-containing protein [Tanacetum coccineum]
MSSVFCPFIAQGPITTEEKVQKKNDVKERSMLLMALPNEHLMTVNQYKDARTLFAAIQTRFVGNEATKKTQKTLLKQIQLAVLGEIISQEDLYLKFLRSLPSEWNTHVVVWRNKPDLDTMSFDDLYNNFKIIEQEVKGTASSSSSSSSSSQNMAFVSSPNNDLEEMDSKWQLELLSIRTKRFFQKTGKKIIINGSDTARYDKSKVECFNCHKMGNFARECKGPRNQDSRNRNQDSSRRTVNVEETSSKAMVAIDGAGFDWSYMADDEVPTNMALMAFSDSEITDKSRKGVGFVSYNVVPPPHTGLFSPLNLDLSYSGLEEFQQPEFEGYGPKPIKSVSEDIFNEVRESLDALLVEELVSDDKLEKKTADSNYHQRERVVSGNNYTRVNYIYSAKKAHSSAHKNIVPRAVLMKTGLRSLITVRPINIAHPKTTVYSAKPTSHFSKSAQSTIKRPYQIRTTLTNKNFSQKVNTAKGNFYTTRPKTVNIARPNSTVVNDVRENQVNAVKASACWGHPQKEDQCYVDSGYSRHMTGNMSYLSNFKKFDRGYVTFGG